MEITILGSGPACPRPGGASSGYLVHAPQGFILVDCGHGVAGRLRAATDLAAVRGIVISHMHPDHYWDLVALKYGFLWSELDAVPIVLPPGGLEELGRLQDAVLDADFFSPPFTLSEYDPMRSLSLGGVEIRFAPTRHAIPGFAMRFSAAGEPGGDIVYGSDTAHTSAIVELARDAGVLILESSYLDDEQSAERIGHLTARGAGRMAAEAEVGLLLLTHYPSGDADALVTEAKASFDGPVEPAVEGATYAA